MTLAAISGFFGNELISGSTVFCCVALSGLGNFYL
jgi:hypothetical protein